MRIDKEKKKKKRFSLFKSSEKKETPKKERKSDSTSSSTKTETNTTKQAVLESEKLTDSTETVTRSIKSDRAKSKDKKAKFKTSKATSNYYAKWNESFQFEIAASPLAFLTLQVYDYNVPSATNKMPRNIKSKLGKGTKFIMIYYDFIHIVC